MGMLSRAEVAARRRARRMAAWLRSLVPHAPVACAVLLNGVVNIVAATRFAPVPIQAVGALGDLTGSLGVLGRGTQTALGATLVLVAVGLFWRMQVAWAFALLLLVVTIGVDVARHQSIATLALPMLILLALVWTRGVFARRTIIATYLISLVSIAAVTAYGTIGSYLLGTGYRPQIRDVTTALYYTVVTLSTVGYGDIVPVTQQTRLFTISLLVVGLGIFATAIASVLGPAITGEMSRIFIPEGRRTRLKDHIIPIGEGAIAENTARELSQRRVEYVRIAEKELASTMSGDAEVVLGDPAEESVLRKAGIAGARMVVAARDDDGENAFISLLAKDLNAHVQVLAVATTARAIRRLKLAGADLVFAPSVVGSRLVADLVEGASIPTEFADLLERM